MNNPFNFIDERNKENTKIDTGDDRVESIGRRRIRGIVSSEEKKRHDKGRQLVLALPIPNNSFYHVNKRNKGKAKIGIVDPLDGFTKYETHGQTKKGPKRKVLCKFFWSLVITYKFFYGIELSHITIA